MVLDVCLQTHDEHELDITGQRGPPNTKIPRMPMNCIWLHMAILFSLAWTALSDSAAAPPQWEVWDNLDFPSAAITLEVGKEVFGLIGSAGQRIEYPVSGAERGQKYEVRVSFSAATSSWVHARLVDGVSQAPHTGRKLLDCEVEKQYWDPKNESELLVIRLQFQRFSGALFTEIEQEPIYYNIVVEPLFMNVPRVGWYAILVGVPLFFVTLTHVTPRVIAVLKKYDVHYELTAKSDVTV
eukprot:Clim_evm1s86 gene=Clim_evmTU1s86